MSNAWAKLMAQFGQKSVAELEKPFTMPACTAVFRIDQLDVKDVDPESKLGQFTSFVLEIKMSPISIVPGSADDAAIAAMGGEQEVLRRAKGRCTYKINWGDKENGVPKPNYVGPVAVTTFFGEALGMFDPEDGKNIGIADVLQPSLLVNKEVVLTCVHKLVNDKPFANFERPQSVESVFG